jgi:hypothetical protein
MGRIAIYLIIENEIYSNAPINISMDKNMENLDLLYSHHYHQLSL